MHQDPNHNNGLNMRVTVSICTWNRSASLKRTLDSLAEMRIPADLKWELLVVNNNSSDDTDSVVDSFSNRLPVRRIFEKAQGLSNARNAGIKVALGDYILWTDDDVIVGPEWLETYCSVFDQRPDAAIFGGPVYPVFEEPVPRWLERGWRVVPSAFAAIDFGTFPLPFSTNKTPFGANFALRRAELLRHPFDPRLGPGTSYYAEETSVMQEMLEHGASGWWVPDAPVQHCIPRERMNLDYIKSYYERTGRTNYYLYSSKQAQRKLRILGRPPWVWRSIVENELIYWYSRAFLPVERWLHAQRNRSTSRGAFDESRRW